MKIYHEAPLALFDEVQQVTDGDYALVHLLNIPQYRRAFKLARLDERETILDNSIFELGTAFDDKAFAKEVLKVRPTWYIVPDVLEDYQGTVDRFTRFVHKYPELPGKRIGVVQGNSINELLRCYHKLEPLCDMLAISFDYSFWLERYGNDSYNKWFALMQGRQELIDRFELWFNHAKPHHLLGCALPQEMKAYRQPWIYSVDTSNPVVHGMLDIHYSDNGLNNKSTLKLADLINAQVSKNRRDTIMYNIEMFRRFCNE